VRRKPSFVCKRFWTAGQRRFKRKARAFITSVAGYKKMNETNTSPRYRAVQFGHKQMQITAGKDGALLLQASNELHSYPERMTDRLIHWATHTPDAVYMAQREKRLDGSLGDWIYLTYAQALKAARSIGQALIDRGVGVERPVAILSENSLEHAKLALGCMYAGVPYCPVSPQYSLLATDFIKLRHVIQTITPGLVFATNAARYGRAVSAVAPEGCTVVFAEGAEDFEGAMSFDSLLSTHPLPAVDAAMKVTSSNTIAKFLFTSGSTKQPKAVINTHGMWCANQQQITQTLPGLVDIPPVLVDWLPWSHTFGGNKNVGLVLFNGGTLYIDEGKPTAAGIAETLRNLREIAPTVYFNVPTGFDYVAQAMESDPQLRARLLSRVKMFFYAGASLSQNVWDSLHRAQEQECGERIVMGTGLGMTESSPSALFTTRAQVRSGDLGQPVPGMKIKLVPSEGKLEIRYWGPNITPGYWRSPKDTQEAFDEEGFFCSGDAVKWRDPKDPSQGLCFDGRIAEDFKLATGTFVNVGPLRAKIIQAGAPYVQDVVITGLDRKEVGAIIFGSPACRELSGLDKDASLEAVMNSAPVQQYLQTMLNRLSEGATGSASFVARAVAATTLPSLELGEVTDKGSINQRAVLLHRAAIVEGLYANTLPGVVHAQVGVAA
jgi:feruloyl-CoA synthase